MNPPSFGSASPMMGGTDALSQVMAQRGVDASVLNQQTPASAGFNPVTGQVTGMSSGMPPAGGAPAAAAPQGMPPESSEASIIIDALKTRLENDSKMKMKELDAKTQPQVPMM